MHCKLISAGPLLSWIPIIDVHVLCTWKLCTSVSEPGTVDENPQKINGKPFCFIHLYGYHTAPNAFRGLFIVMYRSLNQSLEHKSRFQSNLNYNVRIIGVLASEFFEQHFVSLDVLYWTILSTSLIPTSCGISSPIKVNLNLMGE